MVKSDNPVLWFDSSPKVIRLVVMMPVRCPPSLRNVEDLLFERGIDICHETVRLWWNRFGPMFASQIRKRRVQAMRQHTHWRWHLDEIYVRIHASAHDHFAQERHLVGRNTYKQQRSGALAEWRSVLA